MRNHWNKLGAIRTTRRSLASWRESFFIDLNLYETARSRRSRIDSFVVFLFLSGLYFPALVTQLQEEWQRRCA